MAVYEDLLKAASINKRENLYFGKSPFFFNFVIEKPKEDRSRYVE
jgi:hypothetical protein